ncbi:MAG TPA: hypothetical protein V6D22_17500 [Candidatus Obscuribacterales bacterium]
MALFTKKSDRVGLIVATVIFALVFLGQLWRLVAHVPVAVNGQVVSQALTVVLAIIALVMAIWMGNIYRHEH